MLATWNKPCKNHRIRHEGQLCATLTSTWGGKKTIWHLDRVQVWHTNNGNSKNILVVIRKLILFLLSCIHTSFAGIKALGPEARARGTWTPCSWQQKKTQTTRNYHSVCTWLLLWFIKISVKIPINPKGFILSTEINLKRSSFLWLTREKYLFRLFPCTKKFTIVNIHIYPNRWYAYMKYVQLNNASASFSLPRPSLNRNRTPVS